ncbi:hypothetical protein A2U01_0094349, partial [Trifolium medium]|nr:hypothetical protein [Trifolium medium]
KALTEELIREGHLKKFLEQSIKEAKGLSENPVPPLKTQNEEGKGKETARKTINTIAGGFYGGGETSSARK